MKRKNTSENLNQAILLLEVRRNNEFINLKEQFYVTYEYLRPVNILKSTFKEIVETTELKKGLGSIAIGIASGFIVKGMLFGGTRNPLKKIAGIMIQSVITNFAAQHSDAIKRITQNIIEATFAKVKNSRRNIPENDIQEQHVN